MGSNRRKRRRRMRKKNKEQGVRGEKRNRE